MEFTHKLRDCTLACMLVFTVTSVLGQQPKTSTSNQPPSALPHRQNNQAQPAEDQQELANLKHELQDLKTKVEGIEWMQEWHSKDLVRVPPESAEFDPSDPPTSYALIYTGAGPLFVAFSKAEPYLDGYKVGVEIGNPYSLTANGFQLHVVWGPRLKGNDYAKWIKEQHTKDFDMVQTLLPGKWNTVEFVLPETNADGLGFLRISLSTNKIRLGVN